MKFVSVFSGCAGFDKGLEVAGHRCVQQCEILPFRRDILSARFPNVPCHDDITTLHGSNLPRHDFIAGGSPCVGLSQAGHLKGMKDDRSALWYDQLRILKEAESRFMVWENVENARRSNGGDDFGIVLAGLDGAGYRAEWTIQSAGGYGAPHRRQRIFLIGLRDPDDDGVERACKLIKFGTRKGMRWIVKTDLFGKPLGFRWPREGYMKDGTAYSIKRRCPTFLPPDNGDGTFARVWTENGTEEKRIGFHWLTPGFNDGERTRYSLESAGKRNTGHGLGNLTEQVCKFRFHWPTPTAGMMKQHSSNPAYAESFRPGGKHEKVQKMLPVVLRLYRYDPAKYPPETRPALSPEWTEILSGFPPYWTDPDTRTVDPLNVTGPWPGAEKVENGYQVAEWETVDCFKSYVPETKHRIGAIGDAVVPQVSWRVGKVLLRAV
jgi:DNA (cytosine-5)-methyltransferase 1